MLHLPQIAHLKERRLAMKFRKYCAFVLLFMCVFAYTFSRTRAQATPVPVKASIQCGQILESELAGESFYQDILLRTPAGTKLNLSVKPLGDGSDLFIFLVDPGEGEITRLNNAGPGQAEEFIEYPISSSSAKIRVMGANPRVSVKQTNDELKNHPLARIIYGASTGGYGIDNYVGKWYGAFTISLGCILRDGTVINPGDTLQPTNQVSPTAVPTLSPQDPTFTGFPGLPPTNFANAVTIPLTSGTPSAGSISAGFDGVFGFTFDGKAGSTVELGVKRLSGNLNLGVVVLSADNKVVFQASLVTSSALTTTFSLPSDGQYTIGVFRVDLLPPDAPQPTAFQVTAKVS
jgi:hypothetical protein